MPEAKTVENPKQEVQVNSNEKQKKAEPTVDVSVAETVADPYCDEKNPRIITFQDVCQAAFMIKGGVDVRLNEVT